MDFSVFDLMYPMAFISVIMGAPWVWMIIDCVSNEPSETKIPWILVIVLGNGIGALVYFFYRRPRRIRAESEKIREKGMGLGN